jgi:hypothetical protein
MKSQPLKRIVVCGLIWFLSAISQSFHVLKFRHLSKRAVSPDEENPFAIMTKSMKVIFFAWRKSLPSHLPVHALRIFL